MTREAVGRHTPRNSPITACTMFWRRYIEVARGDPDRPGTAGILRPPPRAAGRAARRTRHQWPVVHSMVMAHSFRGHGDVSSTPMIPHGGGPSSYRLPKMTQDTPRITFPDEAAVGHPAQQENYSKDLRTYFRAPTLSTSIKNLIPVESAALDPQYYGARVRTGKCGAVAHASANIPGVTRFRVKKTNAKRTPPIFTSSPQNSAGRRHRRPRRVR